jgi:hypothetical protein
MKRQILQRPLKESTLKPWIEFKQLNTGTAGTMNLWVP